LLVIWGIAIVIYKPFPSLNSLISLIKIFTFLIFDIHNTLAHCTLAGGHVKFMLAQNSQNMINVKMFFENFIFWEFLKIKNFFSLVEFMKQKKSPNSLLVIWGIAIVIYKSFPSLSSQASFIKKFTFLIFDIHNCTLACGHIRYLFKTIKLTTPYRKIHL